MKMNNFEFSDLIAGYVMDYDGKERFRMKTTDGRIFDVILGSNLYARMVRNLSEPYKDCTAQIPNMLKTDQLLFVYGIFYPNGESKEDYVFEAKCIDFVGKDKDSFRFEEINWWAVQAGQVAEFFTQAQFGDDINYDKYRTSLALTGEQKDSFRQETDTISRLIYGLASAYMLTGEEKFLEGAEKGSAYLQDHMKFYDTDENIVYWYHGIDVKQGKEHKVFTSEFGDDYDAIPMYEQIYALAGLTQTYRITGNPAILRDIELTMELFERFYHDKDKGGYFSHIDPIFLDPMSEGLGPNKGRKNWNSVGDHAPAYLINLCLATGEQKYYDFLEYTADTITKYFKDYENSPFVQEKFMEDWSHDYDWGWQKNRGVVGHNLKIAWNLMRVNNYIEKEEYVEFSKKIAEIMPTVGMDNQRFGWYDVMERNTKDGEDFHRFAWHDRKAWWQQEQGILAYQILYGVLKDEKYLKYARESASFYNAFFLDHEDGAVYFNVLNNGIPYLLGTERLKGSHSMSAYHSVELAYLSAVYTNLLNTKKPLDLYFKPMPGAFRDNLLRVEPDILPKGSVKIASVTVDGNEWTHFDSEKLTVTVPATNKRPKIKVTIVPVD
ncbi:MAG: AGE family epimerase/isomerase [Lachnospiraceae bacterium]|nr:AGE family epimerase/isomerase [Lachnospiraceae bacterium]